MKTARTLSLSMALLLLCAMSWASTIVYTFKVVDDSGTPVAGATLAQNTVKSLASATLGNAVAGLTLTPVDLANGDYGIAYDPEGSNGEIIVNFTASKVGSTITGQNASVSVNLTKDSSRVLNADVATSTRNSVTPPTVVQVRQEMDANSTQFASHSTDLGILKTRVPQTLLFDGAGNLQAQVKAYFTNLDPATLVLSATAASWNSAGSIGAKINSAGSASDPLANPTSGYTTAGTVGKLLVDNINATIGSRMAAGNVTVGGYATGQDPATLVLNATLYGGLTFKQMQAVNFALQLDADRTWNPTTHLSIYTWYVRTGINTVDRTKPLVTKTTLYDNTNAVIMTQNTNIVAGNLP